MNREQFECSVMFVKKILEEGFLEADHVAQACKVTTDTVNAWKSGEKEPHEWQCRTVIPLFKNWFWKIREFDAQISLHILDVLKSERAPIENKRPTKQNLTSASQIYFIKCEDRVKIGFTNDLKSRLPCLQTGSPFPMEILFAMPGDVAKEKALHKQFSKYHITGEWFQYSEPIEAYINQYGPGRDPGVF